MFVFGGSSKNDSQMSCGDGVSCGGEEGMSPTARTKRGSPSKRRGSPIRQLSPLGEHDQPRKGSGTATDLIGGSGGVSLDGQSLILPADGGGGFGADDVSSINTSLHEYQQGGGTTLGGQMRILGTMDHDEEVPTMRTSEDDHDEEDSYGYDDRPPMNKSAQANATSGRYEHKSASYHSRQNSRHSRGGGGTDGSRRSRHSRSSGSHHVQKKSFDYDEDDYDDDETCLPQWIVDAPNWLKLVIIMSTALLVGAIVLIGVGAALAIPDQDSDQSNVQQQNPNADNNNGNSPPVPPGFGGSIPTPAPVTIVITSPPDSNPSVAPITTPTDDGDDTPPSGSPPTTPGGGGGFFPTTSPPGDGQESSPTTPPPTSPMPVAPPTELPFGATFSPSKSPTPAPTPAPTSSVVNFFVTAGRFTGDALEDLPDQLASIPDIDGNTVMFHLGDWNSPFATSCVESSYQENDELYRNSAIPVYFVPGDNEFNDCPNPAQAFQGFWYNYMLGFETKYWDPPTAYNIERQEPDYSENFAFIQKGLLTVSINLVGGNVHNNREWEDRHQADLDWIDEQYNTYQGQFTAMVVLAHADPVVQANSAFFDIFYERVAQDYSDIQIIYIHRNLGVEPWSLEPNFQSIPNLMVVVVEGSVWPPMLVQIDASAGIVDIDQEQWYIDYLGGGDF